MTIITHDDGTGERVHVAYEGPYPWDDGALEKAKAGLDGWALTRGAHAEYLEGDRLSDWDTATGTFNGKRPVYEPSEAEKLSAEMGELKTLMASSDWYAARQAKTGIPIPEEVLAEYLEALARYNDLELRLKSLGDTHVD